MPIAILFWILMVLWLLFGAVPLARAQTKDWSGVGTWLLPWVAVALLGWHVFGPILRG